MTIYHYRAHQQLGDALLFVTPGKMYLQLCDAETVSEIFQRRSDFPRPPEATGKNSIYLHKLSYQPLTSGL